MKSFFYIHIRSLFAPESTKHIGWPLKTVLRMLRGGYGR